MNPHYSLYILTDCPFCKRAVSLLESKKLPFVVIVMDKDPEFLEKIKKDFNHKTVPIVTESSEEGNKLIGGCDDLERHLESKNA